MPALRVASVGHVTTISRPIPRAFGALGSALRYPPLVAFVVTLVSMLLALGVVSTAYAALHGSTAFPGVSVAGVPIGDLDRAAAEARLRAELPAANQGSLSVKVDGEVTQVSYAELGRDYALADMLDRAFSIGRSGSFVQNAGEQFRVLTSGTDVAPEVGWSDAQLKSFLDGVIATESSQPANAEVLRDAAGGYTAVPAHIGRAIDSATLHASVVAALAQPAAGDVVIDADATVIQPAIPTAAAEDAVNRFNAATSVPITASGGGVSATLDSSVLRSWVSLQPAAASTGWDVIVDQNAISTFFAPYAAQIDRQAADATLQMTNDGLVAVAGITGQEFSLPDTVGQIANLISARAAGGSGSSVQLAVTSTDPSFTTAQATQFAGQVQMVSSWTTPFIPGISNFNGQNIRVPAKILNGTLVEAGARFSFLDGVGEISPATGFGLGGAIIRGHTREQGAMGGGICSASTTLFNAALRYGYQIDARTQHAYYINRYPVGLDATVFRDGSQTVDMAFTNDSQYPLWIRGIAGKRKVTFQIWTIPDGRTVKIGKASVSNREQAQDTTVVDPTMEPGTSERIEYPVDGFSAVVTRVVYDASGAVLHADTFRSSYITVTGVTNVGPTPIPPPTEPPPTEPPPPPLPAP